MALGAAICLGAGVSLTACTPGLNWRESRLDKNGAVVLMPCKPSQRDRSLMLAGASTHMAMQSCEADGSVYALSSADIGDAGLAASALAEWQRTTAENIGARPVSRDVPGARGLASGSNVMSLRLEGRGPDGAPLMAQTLFFSKGTKIFQAAVVSAKMQTDNADTFFEGINLQ